MANEQQVPRLLHQLVRKAHIGIATRCHQCFRDRDVNTMCQECTEKPWLCSTICFERYHQRMHPELYPSLLPIFSPSVLRTREGQCRSPSRLQFRFRRGPKPKWPRLHQLTPLGKPPRSYGRAGPPATRRLIICEQCFYEKKIENTQD